jgi:lipoprotein-anchoring transpeptidase ErfK/SrfK
MNSLPPRALSRKPAPRRRAPAQHPQHPKSARSRGGLRLQPTTLILALVAVGGAVVLLTALVVGAAVLANNRVAPGVSVGAVEIGGRSLDAAQAALENAYASAQVALTDGERSWNVSLNELGAALDAPRAANQARRATANAQIVPTYTIDLVRTQETLIRLSETINIDAVPGYPPQIGRAIDIPWALDRLRTDPTAELADGVFELPMIESVPEVVETRPAYTGATTTHVVEAGQELGLIAREYGVGIDDILAQNDISDANLIFPGQELLIPASGSYVPEDIPPAPTTSGRAILVSTGEQRIYAYDNGEMVRTHLVSTGTAETPTVLGDYRIYARLVADDMRGPDYFLPQVPYTMYFHQGYAIHGTYWHNSFGRPMSHGCVNLPVAEAEWFFNFADRGTLVRVI